MSVVDFQQIVRSVFLRLRQDRFTLGIGELFAALQVIDSDLVNSDLGALQEVIELLWCHSSEEARRFNSAWAEITTTLARLQNPDETPPQPDEPSDTSAISPLDHTTLPAQSDSSAEQLHLSPELTAFPVRTPLALAGEYNPNLQAHFPLTRRAMSYAWRYLRRPVADGPLDVLDVEATVEQAALQGFFIAPVFRRRERNHAHLVLLVDQGGSMTPTHRFTRDLVETAQTTNQLDWLHIFYFHNVPADNVYLNPHLTQSTPTDEIIDLCSADTSVLLISDAGAARGYRDLKRINATTRFLSRIKRRTMLIAWLNPMPEQRWPNTSAQIISHIVPMFPMDTNGLNDAIDVIRGQPFKRNL